MDINQYKQDFNNAAYSGDIDERMTFKSYLLYRISVLRGYRKRKILFAVASGYNYYGENFYNK